MKTTTPRPNCKACGKPLRAYRYSRDAYLRSARRDRLRAAKAPSGSARDQYIRWAEISEQDAERCPPEPRFGNYGDNHFCGVSCGYVFAVRALKNGVVCGVEA